MNRRSVVGLWAVWSAALLFLSSVAARQPLISNNPWQPPQLAGFAPPLARWDSNWYWSIAVNGYHYEPPHLQNNTDFYPLYPLLVRGLTRVTSLPVFWVGIGFSLLCLLPALLLFRDMIRGWSEEERGSADFFGVASLLLFPTAFYFAAFYTESLFFLLTVGALRAAQRQRWTWAGLAAAGASLTRLNGFLLVVPIAWYCWEAAGRRWSGLTARSATGLLGSVLGAAIYPAYLWSRWGDPLLYVHGKFGGGWAQKRQAPWRLLIQVVAEARANVFHPGPEGRLNFWLKLGSLLLFALLTVLLFRRGLIAEGLYTGANIFLLAGSGTIDASHRYVLVLFPGFFIMGDFLRRRPVLSFAYALGGAGLGVILLTRFVAWIYVA